MTAALILGCISVGFLIGLAWMDYIMKCECAKRRYGRWNPENGKWQWYTQSGYSRARGFFQ